MVALLWAFAGGSALAQDDDDAEAQGNEAEAVAAQAEAQEFLEKAAGARFWRMWQAQTVQASELTPTVQDIRFRALGERNWLNVRWMLRGARGRSDNSIRVAMLQQEAPFAAYIRPRGFRPELDMEELARDAWRVELWYANHGYFDARVMGWEASTWRGGRLPPKLALPAFRSPAVRVVGVVDEGVPSVIREVRVEGIEEAGAPIRLKIERSVKDIQGGTFTIDAPYALAGLVEDLLRGQSYARVSTEVKVDAFPEEHVVDVVVQVEPGPPCTFGDVEVRGQVGVPERFIRDQITIEPGDSFSPRVLNETQARLFNLGTFSVVQVRPDLSVDGSVIPVAVEVTEAKFQRLRVGAGSAVSLEGVELRVPVRYTHANVAGRLIRFEAEATGGWRLYFPDAVKQGDAVGTVQDLDNGPFLESEVSTLWPRFLEIKRLTLNPSAGFEYSQTPEQTLTNLRLTPAFTWRFTPTMSMTPSYQYELWRADQVFEDDRPNLGAKDQLTDYTLHFLKLNFLVDHRDDPLFTRRGYYGSFTVADAGRWLLPGFTFSTVEVDLRKYWAVQRPVRSVAAVRLAGGLARPYGDDPDTAVVPYNDLFFLGGPDTVRGWAQNHLGPRICQDTSGDTAVQFPCEDFESKGLDRGDVEVYPAGSQAVLWATLEYRIDGPFSLDYAVFSDAGVFWSTLYDAPLQPVYPSVGAGIRYASPVGPVRVDLAFRLLSDEPQFAMDRGYGLHLALTEAF